MKKNIISIIAFLGIYLFVTGTSFAVFTFVLPSSLNIINQNNDQDQATTQTQAQKDSKFKMLLDVSGPKTEVCPINGALFNKTEKDSWMKRRPLLVMIENHEEARPQSGLSNADVIYETVAEGGITRFMGVYYCNAQAYEVMLWPIRSARSYYLDWASEYGNNPLYTHVGGANCNHGCPGSTSKADALGQIEKYGWGGAMGNDLSQYSIGYPTFWRDYERLGHTVATEHTMYSTTERLWAVAAKRDWNYTDSDDVAWDEDFVPWKFADESKIEQGTTNKVNYNFWANSPAGDYSVSWDYEPTSKLYKRLQSGQPHIDLNTNEQLTAKNLVVMYSVESNANDGYPNNAHLVYGLIGKGKAVLFQDGNAEKLTWEKKTRTARTIYYGEDGKEIQFLPGTVWISNIPVGDTSLEY